MKMRNKLELSCFFIVWVLVGCASYPPQVIVNKWDYTGGLENQMRSGAIPPPAGLLSVPPDYISSSPQVENSKAVVFHNTTGLGTNSKPVSYVVVIDDQKRLVIPPGEATGTQYFEEYGDHKGQLFWEKEAPPDRLKKDKVFVIPIWPDDGMKIVRLLPQGRVSVEITRSGFY